MTDDRMTLMDLVEKSADEDLVRDMLAYAAERLMEMEVEAATGAPKGARTSVRTAQRNGYRERGWETRAGRIDLAIPRLRKGSYFPVREAHPGAAQNGGEGPRGRHTGSLRSRRLDALRR